MIPESYFAITHVVKLWNKKEDENLVHVRLCHFRTNSAVAKSDFKNNLHISPIGLKTEFILKEHYNTQIN